MKRLTGWGIVVLTACGGDGGSGSADTLGEGATSSGSSPTSTANGVDESMGNAGPTSGADSTGGSTLGTVGDSSSSDGGSESGAVECPFEPSPVLAAIPDNTALDLGSYDCTERLPQIGVTCHKIFDFSGIDYDAYAHRMVIFGGGHSASGRTDVDAFDLATLGWGSMYPSMSCEEVEAEDLDPRGFHTATGHPVARHTYDQNVIAEVDGSPRLLMFSSEGLGGYCHPYNADIHAVASLALDDDAAAWEYSPEFLPRLPWGYAGAAEHDPVSGMVILMGRSAGAGPSYLWVYDPESSEVVASLSVPNIGIHQTLHYDPIGDRMILLWEGDDVLEQREVKLDRSDWAATTVAELVTQGVPAARARASAYDSHNHIIGAFGEAGVFSALDLSTDTWTSHVVNVQADDPELAMGLPKSFAMDYDPIDNVFIVVVSRGLSNRTWAYRYAGPAQACTSSRER